MDFTFIISLSLWLSTLIVSVLLLVQLNKLFKKLNSMKVITITKQDVIDYNSECLVNKWVNSNVIRIKDSSAEIGKKSDDPQKFLYPNYLQECDSLGLEALSLAKFTTSLMKVLESDKGLTHDKLKKDNTYVISNIKLRV